MVHRGENLGIPLARALHGQQRKAFVTTRPSVKGKRRLGTIQRVCSGNEVIGVIASAAGVIQHSGPGQIMLLHFKALGYQDLLQR